MDWRGNGNCSTVDPDLMYPAPHDTAAEIAAITICAGCPVIDQCAQSAMERAEPWGVWGGMTERERRHRAAGKIWQCPNCKRPHHRPHWNQIYCRACRTPKQHTLSGNAKAGVGGSGRPRTQRPPCGTYKAYQRHKSYGEPVDDACRRACNEYVQQRRMTQAAAV